MMRHRRWVIVVLCLSVSLLLLSQLSSASNTFHVNEAATRMLLEEEATKVSLALVNPLGREFAARVRFEVLDPQGGLRASAESDETIRRGASALVVPLPLRFAGLDTEEQRELLWYRLRYRITPEPAAREGVAPIEGIISLSEITPDIFELRVAAKGYARDGTRYHALAGAVHPVSSRPVPGIKVEAEIVFDDGAQSGKVKAAGVTNDEGFAPLDFELPREIKDDGQLELKVVASRGAFVEEAETELQLHREALVMLSTDKPLYQPGQTLHLRALVFDESKHALAGASAELKINDPEGTTVFRSPLVTSRFGIAGLDWPIPENTRLGDYIIRIELDDERYDEQVTTQSVKISRYELPNFAVGVKPDRAYYLSGQDAEVEVRADYLFGQPVKRGRVRVVRETERRWNYREQKWETEEADKYEGETDAEGRYTARINLRKAHAQLNGEDYSRFHDLTYAAYFTDPTTNRTEQRRFDLRVTKDPIHVYIFEGIERQAKNFPLQFYLSTYYADGTPAECEVEIRVAGESNHAVSAPPLQSIRTNRYGVAKVHGLALPPREAEGREASLLFTARDGKGLLGHQSNDFWYEERPVIRLETDKSLYRTGEPVKVNITGSEPQMRLLVDVWKGDVALRSEAVSLRDGRAALTVPYSPEFGEGVTLTAYAAPDAQTSYYDWPAASRQVIYPRERDLRVDVQLSQQTYKPGEEARADFNVHAPDGGSIESALGIVIFDKAVEERARTDRDFGSNYGFYEAYRRLNGYSGSVSGIGGADLFKLDMSKPIPGDLALVAEILLRTYANVPRIFGGDQFEMNQQEVFAKLIERQTAPMTAALVKRYEQEMEHPQDEAGLRSLLAAGGVDFDGVLDPWGTPYRAQFSIARETDVLELVSAGADKRFLTTDDFKASRLSWPYFRKLGETINRAAENYHARTGGFIRDAATLREELRASGVDMEALRDRWGQPYRVDFSVSGINYLISITSLGADRKPEPEANSYSDNFIIWTTATDYFADPRAKIEEALADFAQKAKRFPQDEAELRDALSRSGINLDGLRDPWGQPYSAIFSKDARYAERHILRSYSRFGEKGKLRQEVTPVIQQMNYIYLRSRGADGTEATVDDFEVARFSRLSVEADGADKRRQALLPFVTYSGASGAISGTVIDVQDAVAPGVKVKATHLTSLQEYETTSDDEGRYLLPNLPVGLYKVQFALPGFTELYIDQVQVRSSNLTKLDARLQVAGATAVVEVVAGNGGTADVLANTTSMSVSTAQFSNFPTQRTVQSLYNTSGRSGLRSSVGGNNFMIDGLSAQMETPRLRENFSETLVWQPSLETDAEGRAALDFKLADNITTWKMAIVGSTVDGKIGLVEKEFRAFQPFFVEHDPPRVLTEGDEIQLPVVVRNYLEKAQDVDLQIAPAQWFTLLGAAQKRIAVPAGDASRQTFDFRASASVKDGSQQITARAAEGGDAIVKPVSVHPDGEELATMDSQIITGAATLNLNLPASVIKNSTRAELKIYPDLMAHVFESIEGILRRPYGCGEQTISSTYPSLLVLRHDRRTNQQSQVAPKASRYLRAGYERLLNYRSANGGFSYWGGRREPDIALTAYALRFLNEAREFIAVDEAVIVAARDWLISQQRPDGSWPTPSYQHGNKRNNVMLTAYIARVLAATNAPGTATQSKPAANDAAATPTKPATPTPLQRALAYLARPMEETNEPYSIAAYALAAHDAGETAVAARAIARLRTLAHEEGGMTYWALETSTPFYGWGLAGRVETTALVVQALARENQANDALVNRGLLYLLRRKDRYGVWYSTQATINVLDTLIALLFKERGGANATGIAATAETGGGGGPIEVVVNNQRVATIPMPSAHQPANPIAVDLSAFIAPGENRIELQREGVALPASAQVVATYYVPWRGTGNGNHPATPTGTPDALSLKVSFDKSEVGITDEVTCKVQAARTERNGYGMLLGEIGLPPGADVDRASLEKAMKESGWSFTRYDILPDRLIVYLWPPTGGLSFEFKFRPRYGLTAQTAASQLYDYYNPEARTVIAPTKFVVK